MKKELATDLKVLSVNICTKEIYYAFLEKEGNEIKLLEDIKTIFPKNLNTKNRMDFVETEASNKIEKYIEIGLTHIVFVIPNPSIRIALNNNLRERIMSMGVFVKCCNGEGVECIYKSKANIGWKKMGYTSKTNPDIILDDTDKVFPNTTYKNNDMRLTLCIGSLVLYDF